MAAAGVLDAVTEEIVRDYVTRRKLLSRSAFRAIVRESRPHYRVGLSHLHTPLPPARTPDNDECDDDGCEAPPPAWAKSTDILGKLVRDLRDRCGLTGEERNARLVYLVVASRVLDHPASAAVKGLSGAGKSYTVECVLRAFPASAVIVMTAMSEHALIYMRESFAHRTLVLYEATALREGREKNEGNQTAMFIRTLLSEGRLVYPTVQKDKHDEHGRIVATAGDYLAVKELVADLMSDAVGTTVKASVRQTVEAVRQLATPGGVTVRQLADHLQLERSAAQYRVQAARNAGFIVNVEDRRGAPARYAPDNPMPAEVALLPEKVPENCHTRPRA
jgi:hypothetical protein